MDFDSVMTAGQIVKFFQQLPPETPVEFDAGHNNIDVEIGFTGEKYVDYQLSRLFCDDHDLFQVSVYPAPADILAKMPDWVTAHVDEDGLHFRRKTMTVNVRAKMGGCDA